MTEPSSEKEPLIPEQGDRVTEHAVEVVHIQSNHQNEQAHNEEHQSISQEQLEGERRLASNLTELFLFLMFTGIELPCSYVWKIVCIFIYALTGVVFPIFLTRKYHADFVVMSSAVLGMHTFFSVICFTHISCRVWKDGTKSYLLLEKLTKRAVAFHGEYTAKIKRLRRIWWYRKRCLKRIPTMLKCPATRLDLKGG